MRDRTILRVVMRTAFRSTCVALLLSCHSPEPPMPALVDVPKAGAASKPVAPTDEHEAGASTASVASRPPPGLWNISVAERSSTCGAGDAGALGVANQPFFVPTKPHKDGKLAANLPVNPFAPYAQQRSDILLEVGQITKSSFKPDKTCAYEMKREVEVASVGADKITLVVRSEYGDATGCARPQRQTSCKHEATMTLTLARALCEARCTVDAKVQPDGGVADVKCSCPDSGP